jgi:DNA-directed RNA polymerase sigma subunit (sigma70/sigma32)
LGEELGLSKERVRQLEAAAFAKMRKSLETSRAKCITSAVMRALRPDQR